MSWHRHNTFTSARNVTAIYWLEDLERAGKTYGELLEYLDGLHIECVVSPIHNRDTYTSEDVRKWCKRHEDDITGDVASEFENRIPKIGDQKKAHIHLAFKLPGRKRVEWFCDLMKDFYPLKSWQMEVIDNWDSMIRYFAHMDSPEKAVYSRYDIHGFGGVNLDMLTKVSNESKLLKVMEVQQYVMENKTRYFHKLCDHYLKNGDIDAYNVLTSRSGYFIGYLRSVRQEWADKKEAENNNR